MAYLNPKPVAEPPLLRIAPFKGINLSVGETQIDPLQSPDMLNMIVDESGSLKKRTGYERVYANSLGPGSINGLHVYRKLDGTTVLLLAHGTKLYTQSGNNQPVEIYSGLANSKLHFFEMGGKCYLLDGTNYLVYDGTTISTVIPYIPTLLISKVPGVNGGGTLLEDLNLLGNGFKETFSGDGTGTEYHLSLKALDETPVLVKVDTVVKTLGTDYTVDFVNGVITFTTVPSVGTNNVEITAYKTQIGFAERIKKCRFSVLFGGTNDTRVFVSGNPGHSNFVWRSGLFDPTYFPENGFYKVGYDGEKVQGFSKQYDYLIIEKERSKWLMHFELQNGEPTFPLKPINDQIGTVSPHSIQSIENSPVSLSRNGVYMLMASNVRDERNVKHISGNVDTRLLKENNIENAISIDFDKKYYLAINGNMYIFNYVINEWYIFDNIKASCFIEINKELYFGSSTDGLLYRFKRDSEKFPYNDDGKFINAYWKSAKISFGSAERNKLVQRLFATMEPNRHTSVNFYYVSDKVSFPRNESNLPDYSILHYGKSFYNDKIFDAKTEFIKAFRMEWFDYGSLDYSLMSYNTSEEPNIVVKKVKVKKVDYYQLVVQNTKLNESLRLDSIALKYLLQNYRK